MKLFQRLIKKVVDFLSKALPVEETPEVLGVNPYKHLQSQLKMAFPSQVITPTSTQEEVMYKAGQAHVLTWIDHHVQKWR